MNNAATKMVSIGFTAGHQMTDCAERIAYRGDMKKASSSFTIVDVKDKDVQAFLDRKSITFPAWMTRSSLASAIRTMDTFASPDVEFAVVQLRSSGKKDRFGQVLVDRVFILDRKGAVVASWNPQT